MRETSSVDSTVQASYEPLTVSVHGADRPGIVNAVAEALAERGGNVLDLSTQLIGDAENPAYVMTLRAEVPRDSSEEISNALIAKAHEMGVHCSVRLDDPDVL